VKDFIRSTACLHHIISRIPSHHGSEGGVFLLEQDYSDKEARQNDVENLKHGIAFTGGIVP